MPYTQTKFVCILSCLILLHACSGEDAGNTANGGAAAGGSVSGSGSSPRATQTPATASSPNAQQTPAAQSTPAATQTPTVMLPPPTPTPGVAVTPVGNPSPQVTQPPLAATPSPTPSPTSVPTPPATPKASPTPVATKSPQPGNSGKVSVKVAALRLNKSALKQDPNYTGQIVAYRSELVKMGLAELEKNHPDTDVVVLPEYSYWDDEDFLDDLYWSFATGSIDLPNYKGLFKGIALLKNGEIYEIDDTLSDKKYADPIRELKQLAIQYQINIAAGTVPVKYYPDRNQYPFMPAEAVFNTMLIINRQGEIEDFDRKLPASDWIVPSPYLFIPSGSDLEVAHSTDYWARGIELTRQTTYPRKMTNSKGEEFSYLPIVCAERTREEMLSALGGEEVDMILYSEAEGDVLQAAEWLSKAYQAGQIPDPKGGDDSSKAIRVIKSQLTDNLVDRKKVLSEQGYIVATDSVSSRVAIFNVSGGPISTLDLNEFYAVATLELPQK